MSDQYKRASGLISLEEELNTIMYNDIGIGHLLCKLNENIYREVKMPGTIQLLASFVKLILKGLTIPFSNNKIQSPKILLSKIAVKNQCNALIDPLKDALKDKAIIYSPDPNQNEIFPYNFRRALRFKSIISIGLFVFKNAAKIRARYALKSLSVNIWNISFTLFLGLTIYTNWKRFFESNSIAQVIVDFDRDHKNSALILAARSVGIPCFSLVHGVINPPYGYYPIIADEIWVWGNYQKKQMMGFGLEQSRIRIVGNPIASDFNIIASQRSRNSEITNIGVALNPMGEKFNKQFLLHTLSFSKQFPSINWIVKLHPSMTKKDYLLEFESQTVSIKSFSELDNESFFSLIDLLLINNSGIGYEALVNSVPIMVHLSSDNSIGHDYVMINGGKAPQINDLDSWHMLLKQIESESNYLDQLLEKERVFLKEYYDEIGINATAKILENIKEIEVN